jgi:potassium/chloride transporter 9
LQYGAGELKAANTTSGHNVFLLRSSNSEKALDVVDYVGMVADTLKMRKNICLCRHFHNLDKKLMIAK